MTLSIILLVGIILFICSTIQGAVGFAFNIFAIPLLIWSGLSLPQAITVTSIPIFMQSLTSTYKLREHIKWKEVAIGSIFRYVGLPLGIYILTFLNSFDKNDIKQIVGVVILLIVGLQTLFKVKPKEKLPKLIVEKISPNHYKVYKPILIGKKCLVCHGDAKHRNKEAYKTIKEKYPNDKAIGYKVGDFRGAFVADIVK